jgi:hypothetical protein
MVASKAVMAMEAITAAMTRGRFDFAFAGMADYRTFRVSWRCGQKMIVAETKSTGPWRPRLRIPDISCPVCGMPMRRAAPANSTINRDKKSGSELVIWFALPAELLMDADPNQAPFAERVRHSAKAGILVQYKTIARVALQAQRQLKEIPLDGGPISLRHAARRRTGAHIFRPLPVFDSAQGREGVMIAVSSKNVGAKPKCLQAYGKAPHAELQDWIRSRIVCLRLRTPFAGFNLGKPYRRHARCSLAAKP